MLIFDKKKRIYEKEPPKATNKPSLFFNLYQ